MGRSRSRSLPRERHRRSPSRSRSRSHERRSSRRSRSRSRSPADLRRRRSRSRSPSSGSLDEERRRKRHKKHASKKAKKEEKKRHKKHKHNRDKEPLDEVEGEELAATSEPEAGIEDKVEQKKEPEKAPIDARSFFEQLQKQEAAKEPVGTVHARGLPAPVSATAISTSDKWECSKAGCGHMNSKHAPACNKCGAMKRLTEWR